MRFIGIPVKEIMPEATDAYSKQAMGVLNKGLKASIKRAIETRFDQFLADLGGQASVEEALDKVVKASSSDFAPKEKEALFARSACSRTISVSSPTTIRVCRRALPVQRAANQVSI